MRTKKVLLNSITSIIGQVLITVISFVSRYYFILILGRTYLGINSLFNQILAMLSLVELGIGPAIIFSLYKPLAEKNYGVVASIMRLYKKIYIGIGCIIAVLGLAVSPIIGLFIKETLPNINLSFIFILFVMNTAISYFFSYKQNLIIADQDKYITNINHYLFYIILNLAQLILIIKTQNYILYLVVQILCTFFENLSISYIANKKYPFLKNKNKDEVDKKVLQNIIKNTKGLICHKIAGVAVDSTDNLIISKFIGIAVVGIYSNYTLVINALLTIVNQLFSSFTASIGNYSVNKNTDSLKELFYSINYMCFLIYSTISICCLVLFNDFIKITFGTEYLFDFFTVFLIVFKFYLKGIRSSLIAFKEALGIFWEDRYRPILEAILNLIFSIFFALKFGIVGVFIGTILSNVLSNLTIEPYILYRYGFKSSCKKYYGIYSVFMALFLIILFTSVVIGSYINVTSVIVFIVKAIVIFLFVFLCNIIPFIRRRESNYLLTRIKQLFSKN